MKHWTDILEYRRPDDASIEHDLDLPPKFKRPYPHQLAKEYKKFGSIRKLAKHYKVHYLHIYNWI